MKNYDSYKDSSVEWVGEIPSHWGISRLANNGKFYKGKGVSKADLTIDGLPVILYGDIYTKYKLKTELLDRRIPVDIAENSFAIETGDLLFAASGETPDEIGKCICYIGESVAYASGDVIVYRQNINNSIFLSYLFNSYKVNEQKAKLSKGEIVVHIYSGQLRDIFFPLPPLDEQTAIAHYLDRKTAEIDELISDKKRLLQLSEEEKTAIINQAVTKGINPDVPMKDSGIEWLGKIPEHWEMKRFKYYFNLITEKVEEDLPKIGLENIESKSGKFIETDSDFAGQGVIFRPKDILFGKLRPYLAKVWIADFNGQAVGDFYVFRSKEDVISEFAKYRILDSSFIEVTNSSTYGSKMPRVNWEFIADLLIAFPNIQEQQSIVHNIESECALIEAKITKTEKLIELLTEYRTALISEVVTGKVKVIE